MVWPPIPGSEETAPLHSEKYMQRVNDLPVSAQSHLHIVMARRNCVPSVSQTLTSPARVIEEQLLRKCPDWSISSSRWTNEAFVTLASCR